MSSAEKERKFVFLAEKERRDKWQDSQDKARRQLYEEGKIGFCGTDDDFRKQNRKINARAVETEEREQYEKLKQKFG
ncbi:MAG: hypothetical protein ABIJ19_01745 [Patescibacteria group bacterium]